MSRTALAFSAAATLAIAAGVIGSQLGLGSWGFTGVALVLGLLVTLIDREGFYGATPRRHVPRP